jgi:hypothetical protein
MPTVSAKQERFMQAVANNPKFAKKAGVSQSVGREFTKKEGDEMKESKAMMKKEVSFMKKKGAPKSMIKHEMKEAGMQAGGVSKKLPVPKQMGSLGMKAGGTVAYKAGGSTASKRADGVASKGKTKGKMMRSGGMCK